MSTTTVSCLPGNCECIMHTFCNRHEESKTELAKHMYDDGSKIWLNLTNGLEAAKSFDDNGIPYDFCRFRSSSFEQKNWSDAIDSMPDDMLMRLALGQQQVIVDYGANKECPRSMYQGIPIAVRMMSLAWGLNTDKNMWIFNRHGAAIRVSDDFAKAAMQLDKKQRNRLKYFKRYVDADEIKIAMLCSSTEHDGDYKYYSSCIKESANDW